MVVMSVPFMIVMVILTLGPLKQLHAEPLPAIPGHGTDVVPAPSTHRLMTEDARSGR